jgi:hypothetical protein
VGSNVISLTAVRDGYLDGWYNLAGAYGADELTFVRKSDQLMTLDWRNHQTSFKSPCRVYLPLPSSSRTPWRMSAAKLD